MGRGKNTTEGAVGKSNHQFFVRDKFVLSYVTLEISEPKSSYF
jgi:hypothetical protein